MVGSDSESTEVLPTRIHRGNREETYTTIRMQVVHIPKCSSFEESSTRANQSQTQFNTLSLALSPTHSISSFFIQLVNPFHTLVLSQQSCFAASSVSLLARLPTSILTLCCPMTRLLHTPSLPLIVPFYQFDSLLNLENTGPKLWVCEILCSYMQWCNKSCMHKKYNTKLIIIQIQFINV